MVIYAVTTPIAPMSQQHLAFSSPFIPSELHRPLFRVSEEPGICSSQTFLKPCLSPPGVLPQVCLGVRTHSLFSHKQHLLHESPTTCLKSNSLLSPFYYSSLSYISPSTSSQVLFVCFTCSLWGFLLLFVCLSCFL